MASLLKFLLGCLVIALGVTCGVIGVKLFGPSGVYLAIFPVTAPYLLYMIYLIGDFCLYLIKGNMKKKYTNKDCIRFVEDMEKAGLQVRHYQGRFSWEGPSVTVRNLEDALNNTKVKCQWDNMGLDVTIYPWESDKGENT